jgi:Zn-dependent protease
LGNILDCCAAGEEGPAVSRSSALSQEQLILLPVWYVVFLLSVTCHEAAHAFAAYRGGDSTAYLGGQVSLNPVPHIRRELFGTVIVPLLSYFLYGAGGGLRWMIGWASAPYDPFWEDRHPRRAALMAAAGPLANLGLALIAFIALKAGLMAGIWQPFISQYYELDHLVAAVGVEGGLLDGLGRFCSVLLSLNLLLFLFNLIPLPPMDGSAVLAGFLEPARGLRERVRRSPMFGLIGLLIVWQIFPYVFWPIYRPVVALLYG